MNKKIANLEYIVDKKFKELRRMQKSLVQDLKELNKLKELKEKEK